MRSRDRIPLLCMCVCLSLSGIAQSFTGTVVDKATKATIPGVNVFLVELETGTTTNKDGVFVIEHAPRKVVHIQLSFIGYRTLTLALDLSDSTEGQFVMEQSHLDLKEVVVSVPLGKLQRESVANVAQRKIGDLQQVPTASLAEALTNIAGVEQNSTGAGIGKPVIRGLSGNRIVTYAQGIRIENQQWGAEHGLGVGEVGIESVEVIKGPASVLYGSDALGGVLYFVDERYAAHDAIETKVASRFLLNSLGTYNSGAVKLHRGRLKLNLFGGFTSNADYQVPSGERVLNTRFDEKNFKASIGFDRKNWISNLRYSFLQNNFGITDTAVYGTQTDRSTAVPFQSIGNHALSFENILFTGRSKVSLILGYMENRRKEFEQDKVHPQLDLDLGTLTYNLKWYSPEISKKVKVVVGSQGMHQTNLNAGPEILIPDATTQDIGVFSMINLDLDKLQIQGGVRLDHRSIDAKEFTTPEITSPALHRSYSSLNYSAGLAYRTEKAVFRAGLSSGFRAPNSSELLSNGVHEGAARFEVGNARLNSENATQGDVSVDYQDEHFGFSINPYFSVIRNFIFLAPTGSETNGLPVFEYLATTAVLYGGEVGIHYHPHGIHWLHIGSSVSYVQAQDGRDTPLPLIPSAKVNTTLKAEFDREGAIRIKDVFVQHIYKFKQDRTAMNETPTPAYHLVHCGIDLIIATKGKPIELTLGVKNLLNENYIDHLSRFKTMGIPDLGRGAYFGISFSLDRQLAAHVP
ncbi:MAG: TonB-dependent receptor [Flavobacteriales bacterium]|nr:TonB-dependent receptor [Flavobacteriales bacterium]